MEKVFSDKTEEGIRLIWMQFDPEKTAEGVRLLREAADAGDPDALCFLARTYMGERYVWEYAALEINGEKAASLLKEGIRRGSACAVLLAMRCGELTPSARKAMPFASLKEVRDDVLGKAEAGHPFCHGSGCSPRWRAVRRAPAAHSRGAAFSALHFPPSARRTR